jgi:antiviral defense system Shedu protein SduA
MTEDYEYHRNKRPDKTYVSKSLSFGQQSDRRFRIASKVFDSPEAHDFALEHGEHVIRITPGRRQEIVAKFYEDNRGIFVLTIQRFTPGTGVPHQTSFSFIGDEIPRLIEFISNLQLIAFPNANGLNVTDADLQKLLLSPEQVRSLIVQNQELVLELASSEITKSDLIALGYRKKQLDRFQKLLCDPDYFEQEKRSGGTTDEGVWQHFFESNKWIFGYGLTYIFLAGLDDRKLEQVVVGHTFTDRGKRADAVMKTKGAIEALCFVEIKKHSTPLLKATHYRAGCWSPSDELSGGVAQLQGTIEQAVRKLSDKLEIHTDNGDPTGEHLFSYQPRSFLVVGSLSEFEIQNGINRDKYRSFELFRRNTVRPEIITYDELYHRAKFIVENPN